MEKYTLILNFYNKPDSLLKMQCDLIRKQTNQPTLVLACFLGNESSKLFLEYAQYIKDHNLSNWKWVFSNHNFKYIGRYQLALNIPTDYIVMLDDDRLPGPSYCEHMVQFAKKHNAIVQQYGWVCDEFEQDGMLLYKDGIGKFIRPATPSSKYKELSNGLDFIKSTYLCGGMTFHKKHLKYLFDEPIYTDQTGEDIIFCMKAANDGVLVATYLPWHVIDTNFNNSFLGHDQYGTESTTVDVAINQNKRNELLNYYKQ